MHFEFEKLDVYQAAIEFIALVDDIVCGRTSLSLSLPLPLPVVLFLIADVGHIGGLHNRIRSNTDLVLKLNVHL